MKRKFLLMSCFTLGISGNVYSDYYISPQGNDTTGDGSESNPWQTISKARDLSGFVYMD